MKKILKVGSLVKKTCKIIDILEENDEKQRLYMVSFDLSETDKASLSKKKKIDVSEIPEHHLATCKRIASTFIFRKKLTFSNLKYVREASVDEGAVEIWKLHNKNKYSFDDIEKALHLSHNDEFWRRNLLTLKGLRQKCRNGMTKFEIIHSKYLSRNGKVNTQESSTYKILE